MNFSKMMSLKYVYLPRTITSRRFYDFAVKVPTLRVIDVPEFYKNGYVDKPDRIQKFSYNKDVDVLLTMDKNSAIDFINNLYKNYVGKYEIELRE